jgi:hypothetical protein
MFLTRTKDKLVAAVLIPGEAKNLPEEERFCWNIFGGGGTVFLLGFWQKWVVGCGFFVVELWWIAGESWEVDGSFFGLEKHATFCGLIFEGFPFWGFGSASSLFVSEMS